MRATLRLSSPAPLAQPRTTSSTRAPSMPVRSTMARDGDGREVVGPDGRQRPAVAADGGPDRVDDPRLAERAG